MTTDTTPQPDDAPRPADELRTPRLTLRRWTNDDVDAALAIHSNPDVARFVRSATLKTPEDAAHWLERVAQDDAPGRGWWLAEAGGVAVATILLKPIQASAGQVVEDVEIGWRADAAHTGRGYVTEAAAAILDEALAGGVPRVVAVTDLDNRASQRVARRIGMRHLGRTRLYYDQELEFFVS